MSAREMVRYENGLEPAFGVAGYRMETPVFKEKTIVLPWGKDKGESSSFIGQTYRQARIKLSPQHYSPKD